MDGGHLRLHLLQGPELLPTCWSQVPYVIVNSRVPQFDFKMLLVIVMLLAIFVALHRTHACFDSKSQLTTQNVSGVVSSLGKVRIWQHNLTRKQLLVTEFENLLDCKHGSHAPKTTFSHGRNSTKTCTEL